MGWLSLESGRIAAVHVGAWEGYSWLAFGTTNVAEHHRQCAAHSGIYHGA